MDKLYQCTKCGKWYKVSQLIHDTNYPAVYCPRADCGKYACIFYDILGVVLTVERITHKEVGITGDMRNNPYVLVSYTPPGKLFMTWNGKSNG